MHQHAMQDKTNKQTNTTTNKTTQSTQRYNLYFATDEGQQATHKPQVLQPVTNTAHNNSRQQSQRCLNPFCHLAPSTQPCRRSVANAPTVANLDLDLKPHTLITNTGNNNDHLRGIMLQKVLSRSPICYVTLRKDRVGVT